MLLQNILREKLKKKLFSDQLSAVSYQRSAVSDQLSAVSYQRSAISFGSGMVFTSTNLRISFPECSAKASIILWAPVRRRFRKKRSKRSDFFSFRNRDGDRSKNKCRQEEHPGKPDTSAH